VIPRNDITSRVETEKQEDKGGSKGERSKKIYPLQPGSGSLFNWDINCEEDNNCGDYNEGYLYEKGPAPTPAVIDPASKDAA